MATQENSTKKNLDNVADQIGKDQKWGKIEQSCGSY